MANKYAWRTSMLANKHVGEQSGANKHVGEQTGANKQPRAVLNTYNYVHYCLQYEYIRNTHNL